MAVASAFLLFFLLAGCSAPRGVSGTTGKTTPVTTVTISASPASIISGGSSTLTVTALNATQVAVNGSDGSTYKLQPNGGTQTVSPAVTTTYTAVATGATGNVTATATVTVAAPAAASVSLTANPPSISSGDSSTLTAIAANATQVVITGTDGSTYNLAATGGTQSVTPSVTTTYTAVATGPGAKATASATVTVTPNPAPTVTIVASPDAITAGSSAILTVKATNATQVTITGSDNSSYTLPSTGGVQSVSPPTTTTYTAIAIGQGGKATATTTLTVTPNPPPTVTITAAPSTITAGQSSSLTVTSSNATQVTITGSDGSSYTLRSPNGNETVTPSTTTTYRAIAVGPGGQSSSSTIVTVNPVPPATVSITASPTTIISGHSSILTVTASNANQVTIAGSDGSTYTLPTNGGTQSVSPTSTTKYKATATGSGGNATDSTTVTVTPPGSINSIDHVIFMLQENHTFDNYFGMLNPYRQQNGWNVGDDGITYNVDGIDDKLNTISNMNDQGTTFPLFKFKSTCIDDETSSWLESYGDISTYDFSTTRQILMDGFVHNAEGYANSCNGGRKCSGNFTDTAGQRAMGYYDQDYLNYYYYMASQFAVSDRWFSPVSSKSIDNRIATFTGGTTQGLVFDPTNDDHLNQLQIPTIFAELNGVPGVSWKIYYTVSVGDCLVGNPCTSSAIQNYYPATDFSSLQDSYQYLYENPIPPGQTTPPACTGSTQPSSVVGDSSNSFCIDTTHIAPLSTYFTDLQNGTLPSFAFIESGSGQNDEHPGSGQSILYGEAQVANIINSFMASSSWKDSVFFFSYDEGGGPYDHVPPVPGHSNDYTNIATLGATPPDIGGTQAAPGITVNPDTYNPCVPPGDVPNIHCDLNDGNNPPGGTPDPGATPTDAAAVYGFAAQHGFRVPNIVISPFTRRHYVSHIPMDHTAIIKFVENRFIGSSAHLTQLDKAQPDLLDFFDFNNIPWKTPPSAPPTPPSVGTSCTPTSMGP